MRQIYFEEAFDNDIPLMKKSLRAARSLLRCDFYRAQNELLFTEIFFDQD